MSDLILSQALVEAGSIRGLAVGPAGGLESAHGIRLTKRTAGSQDRRTNKIDVQRGEARP